MAHPRRVVTAALLAALVALAPRPAIAAPAASAGASDERAFPRGATPRREGAPALGPAPELGGARALHVEPSPEAAREAARLRAEAADLRQRLAASEGQRATVLEQVRRLDLERALAQAEAQAARAQEIEESRAAQRAEARAASLGARLHGLRQRAALVARSLYVEGRHGPWERLLGRNSGGIALASAVMERESSLARDLARTEEEARLAARDAARRASTSLRASEDAERAEALARRQSSSRQQALRGLAESARRDAQAAEEKERAADELLAALSPSSLARRSRALGDARSRDLPEERTGVLSDSARGLLPDATPLPGLELQRGRLPWPLHARPAVLERWGPVRDPVRGTRTFRHGIVMQARHGEPIRAVAPGRVLFVDWYKGFGRCLVLDHGRGFLTVHAHAESFAVQPGDLVETGALLGTAGDTGSLSGPRLWFQIQRQGESVDPLQWLDGG